MLDLAGDRGFAEALLDRLLARPCATLS